MDFSVFLKSAIELLQNIFPEDLYRAIPEIMVYLVDGFGNPTRIDYGTGHELSFIMFLCSLFKIGYLKETDQAAIACKAFVKYVRLIAIGHIKRGFELLPSIP